MDGSGAWWNHSGRLTTWFKSLMISTNNPHGWNVEWNKDKFYSSDYLVDNQKTDT